MTGRCSGVGVMFFRFGFSAIGEHGAGVKLPTRTAASFFSTSSSQGVKRPRQEWFPGEQLRQELLVLLLELEEFAA